MSRVILCGLLAGGWIVALAHAASGQSCYSTPTYSYRSYSYGTPSYSYAAPYVAPKKEYKAEPYYLRFLAVIPLVDYPSYSAVYAPAPATVAAQAAPAPQTPAPAAAQPNGDLAKIMAALGTINKSVELIDARLNRLEGGGNGGNGAPAPRQGQRAPEQPPGPQQTAQQIVAAKCVVCHDHKQAGDWGGGFTLVDEAGKIERISDKAVRKLIKHCMAATMPPKEAPKGFTGKLPAPLTDQEAGTLVSFYSGATKDARQERLEISETRPAARRLVRK